MPGTRWDAARADADLWHLWETREAWATEARMRIRTYTGTRKQGDTNLDLHVKQDESHLTWVVPPGNEPSSVACLRAPQVSEITRILRTINTKDAFGSLNLLPSPSISDATLSTRYAAIVRTLRRHKDERGSDWKKHNQAVKRLNQALKQLYNPNANATPYVEHDGLGVGLSGNTDEKEAAEAATKWSSRALGYTQTVNAKPMPTQGQREKWVWARQGQAPKVVPIPATKQSESISSKLL